MAYNKHNFSTGDVLTAAAMNAIEDAIVTNEANIKLKADENMVATLDSQVQNLSGTVTSLDEGVDLAYNTALDAKNTANTVASTVESMPKSFKTVNGNPITGEGNIVVTGDGVGGYTVTNQLKTGIAYKVILGNANSYMTLHFFSEDGVEKIIRGIETNVVFHSGHVNAAFHCYLRKIQAGSGVITISSELNGKQYETEFVDENIFLTDSFANCYFTFDDSSSNIIYQYELVGYPIYTENAKNAITAENAIHSTTADSSTVSTMISTGYRFTLPENMFYNLNLGGEQSNVSVTPLTGESDEQIVTIYFNKAFMLKQEDGVTGGGKIYIPLKTDLLSAMSNNFGRDIDFNLKFRGKEYNSSEMTIGSQYMIEQDYITITTNGNSSDSSNEFAFSCEIPVVPNHYYLIIDTPKIYG